MSVLPFVGRSEARPAAIAALRAEATAGILEGLLDLVILDCLEGDHEALRRLSRVSVTLAEALTLAAEGRVAVFSRPPGRSELRMTARKGVGRSAALREQGAGVSSVGETQRATIAPVTAPTAPLPAPRETDQFAARRGNVGAEGAPGSGCIHPSFPSSRGQARPSAPALFPEVE